MTVLMQVIEGRSSIIGSVTEAWKSPRHGSLTEQDLDDLLRESMQLGQTLKEAWPLLVDRLFDDQIQDVEGEGRRFQQALAKVLANLQEVQTLVSAEKRSGILWSNLDRIVHELSGIQAEVEKTWPFVNWRMVEESRAAYLRGEYQSPRDLLRESQNTGSASD